MESSKTWIDWVFLAALIMVVMTLLFSGVNALESTSWMKASHGRAALGVLTIIAAVATANCLMLVGAAVCLSRLGQRRTVRTAASERRAGPESLLHQP